MPKYDFRCETCALEFSETLPMGTINLPLCPTCTNAKAVRKLIRAPMVHFKGSGFYKTDSGTSVQQAPKISTEAKPSEKIAETKSGETKAPEKKNESSTKAA